MFVLYIYNPVPSVVWWSTYQGKADWAGKWTGSDHLVDLHTNSWSPPPLVEFPQHRAVIPMILIIIIIKNNHKNNPNNNAFLFLNIRKIVLLLLLLLLLLLCCCRADKSHADLTKHCLLPTCSTADSSNHTYFWFRIVTEIEVSGDAL